MDATRDLASRGMHGDEQAIEALHLSNVADLDYQSLPEKLTKDILERIYTLSAKAALSGKCLGIDLLKSSATHVMEMTQLLASKELKCSLKYTLDKDDVVRQMSALCKDRYQWLKSLGEKEGSPTLKELQWLSETIAYAHQGDDVSLDLLNLKRLPTLKISKPEKVPSHMSLHVDFKRASEIASFGRYSLDSTLRIVNVLGMSIFEYMAGKYYPDSKKVNSQIDGQDVSSTLYEELRNIKDWLDRVKALHKQADKMDENDSDTAKDPSYDPEGCMTNSEGGESDSKEPGPSTSGKKPLTSVAIKKSIKRKVPVEESDDTDSKQLTSTEEPGSSTSRKSKKALKLASTEKFKKRKVIDKESDNTDSEPSPSTTKPFKQASSGTRKSRTAKETVPGSRYPKKAKSTSSETSSDPEKPKARSHHKKSKCPYCKKEVFDLKRHLRMHARQEEIEEGDVDKAFNVAAKKIKRRGPQRSGKRKGLPLKWCPIADCSFVTCHMRKHLANKHRVKAGGYLESLLKVARLYQGKYEVDDLSNPKCKKEPERSVSSAVPMVSLENNGEESGREGQDLALEENSSYSEDDDNDEDFPGFQLQEDFFTNPSPKTNREKWLILFFKWLNTADAGRKKNRNRLQHASHIRTILEDLQPRGEGIHILSVDEGQIVWTDWVDVKLSTLKSGTINGYLGTYEKFLQFVVEERVRASEFPPLHEDVRRIFRNIIPKLKGWRRTVDLEGRVNTNQRRMNECTYHLTTEDVNAFLSSPVVVSAKKVYAHAREKQTLSINEMCEARDYLITLISLKTGTRPGALET